MCIDHISLRSDAVRLNISYKLNKCSPNHVSLTSLHCNSGFGAFNSKPSRCITFIPILFANIPTYMPSCLKKDDKWKKPQQTKLPHRKTKCFQHETHAKIWIKHPWKFSLPNLLPFLPLLKPQGFLLKLPSHKISFGEISLHREERTASMLTKTSSASVFKRKENLLLIAYSKPISIFLV